VTDGTASFKIFLAYKNFFGVDDGEMYQTLELAKRLGVIVTAHCENAELVARRQQKLLAEGKIGPSGMNPAVRVGRSRRHWPVRNVCRKYGSDRLRGSSVMRESIARRAGR